MSEYVYGLHDFHPENEDEVGFHTGDRIEVIEKDDLYQDGWWKGRNPTGEEGLFPVGYTTSSPPEANGANHAEPALAMSSLQPLQEESETESSRIHSPVPRLPPDPSAFYRNEEEKAPEDETNAFHNRKASESDGEVMRATITDVQKALEQLGRNGSGADDYDGFSFASTKEGGDTDDTDFDLSDLDGGFQSGEKEDWHKNARRALAAKAKRALENAKQLEALITTGSSTSRRAVVPPIDVEMSDESEAEDEELNGLSQRSHPGILEEDENDLEGPSHATPFTVTQNHVEVPPVGESEVPTASINVQSFAVPLVPPATTHNPVEVFPMDESNLPTASLDVQSFAVPPVASAATQDLVEAPPMAESKTITVPPNIQWISVSPVSPTTSSEYKSRQSLSITLPDDLKKIHPSEWSLEQVIEWLKSKGFDQDICDKFAEQEITGDVLLELDANVLKTEIGIQTYGKRIRIANAITELRRPSSFEFSDSNNPSPLHTQTIFQRSIPHLSHSRAQSQSQSHHSFPGSSPSTHPKHGHSHSLQSSSGVSFSYLQPLSQVNGTDVHSIDSTLETQHSDALSTPVGSGLLLTPMRRPPSLSASPSDGALKDSRPTTIQAGSNVSHSEDRGHLSDSEAVHTTSSMHRRIFGRSHDSTPSVAGSKESSPTVLSDKDSVKEKEKGGSINSGSNRSKSKKSIEFGKHGDRLSIFGGSFVGHISKHRKPAPSEEGLSERSSKFTLPRLQSAIRKSSSSSHRASSPLASPRKDKMSPTPTSPPKDKELFSNESKKRGHLHRRTSSSPHSVPGHISAHDPQPENGTIAPVTQGKSILEQISQPDHAGWMRKKGARYHNWKTRYFVLQGPHMFCLRSNSTTETRLKEYINVRGYRVTVDEGIDPGRYGFRIDHDEDKTHYFSADEKAIIREWMKAIMKATIGRDYTTPVISSCNVPTIPLVVAQAMNPAPRPPSPSARDATQRAMRRENTSQLSTRDARVLMGLPAESKDEHNHVTSLFTNGNLAESPLAVSPSGIPPPRPSRGSKSFPMTKRVAAEGALIEWANSHLPDHLQVLVPTGPLYGGLALLRLVESIKGQPTSPPVPDSAFPVDANDDRVDGLLRLFDVLLKNDVKMGSVSTIDIRQGNREKVVQLLKALKSWEDKRKMLSKSIAMPPIYPQQLMLSVVM